MTRWSKGAAALLVAVLFAGCLQGDQDPDAGVAPEDPVDPAPTGNGTDNQTADEPLEIPEAPLPPTTFTATGCNAVVLLAVDEYGAIDGNLPAGFHPADVFYLLRLDQEANIGQGAIGLVAVACEDNSITGTPFGLVMPGTLVYTPDVGLNASLVDGYQVFVATAEPAIADVFELYGWDVDRNITLDLAVLADQDIQEEVGDSKVPGAAVGQVAATWDGLELFSGIVTASTTYHTTSGTQDEIRFWYDTPEGLTYSENKVSEHGKSGGATCSFTEGTRYAQVIGRSDCNQGTGPVGLIVADFDLETTLIRLHGIHA